MHNAHIMSYNVGKFLFEQKTCLQYKNNLPETLSSFTSVSAACSFCTDMCLWFALDSKHDYSLSAEV